MDAIYRQKGERINYTPEGEGNDVEAGQIMSIGSKVGISENFIPVGSTGSLALVGVFEAPCDTSGSFAFGDDLYYNGSEFEASGTNASHATFHQLSSTLSAEGKGMVCLKH